MPDTSPRTRIVATAYGRTDVGRQREHNEDQFLVGPDLGLFVVCDGMGGNNAGEVASALATKSLQNFFQATEDGPLPGKLRKEDESLTDSERRLVVGVRKANSDVYEISSTRIEHQGMGSTIVALHASSSTGSIEIAHIGDSRAYRIRDGTIEQLTRDHSLIGDALAWNPNLTEEELSRLPKNIISRALGLKRYVEVDVKSETALPGDVYLLCSDGLSGMVKDAQMLEVIQLSDDLDEACDNLIALANEAGGSDNITAVAVRIEADPSGVPADSLPAPSPRAAAAGSDAVGEHEQDSDDDSDDDYDPDSDRDPELDRDADRDPDPDHDHDPAHDPDHDHDRDPVLDQHPEPAAAPVLESEPAIEPAPATQPASTPGVPAPGIPAPNAPDISVSAVAVDELLSYIDGAPDDDASGKNGAVARCASCGDFPTPGDLFCGHCGARIPP